MYTDTPTQTHTGTDRQTHTYTSPHKKLGQVGGTGRQVGEQGTGWVDRVGRTGWGDRGDRLGDRWGDRVGEQDG